MAAVSTSSLTITTLPSCHYSPMAVVSTASHLHLKTVISSSLSCRRQLILPSLLPSSMLLLPFRPSFFCFLSCLRSQSARPTSIIAVRAMSLDGVNSSESSSNNETREPILLPGCDYNHWLIVMEFPKDPAPTREQMIETYLSTLATVLGSMEKAKKNMYAFSTTTYTGFQCMVSEETSERFKGLPGVLWVLPDSYIDVKNKDYGGDKYINGEIVPCKYQTYQSNQRNSSKYEKKKYVRRKIGPSTPIQGTLQPGSASS